MTLDDNEKILNIKKTDEFKSNLKTILSQTVIDSKDAEEILIKNNNNLVNTLIEILEPYKQTTNSEKDTDTDNAAQQGQDNIETYILVI